MKRRNSFIDIRRINLNAEMYKPKPNRFKQGALCSFVGLCICTPMTNGLLIPLKILLNKFPLWIYK